SGGGATQQNQVAIRRPAIQASATLLGTSILTALPSVASPESPAFVESLRRGQPENDTDDDPDPAPEPDSVTGPDGPDPDIDDAEPVEIDPANPTGSDDPDTVDPDDLEP